ncbi:MAG: glycosyltransferase family 10 [Lyngbya sp.]|nr:glycosyltransferase family 10 [Lyngbya sp.]
MSEKIVGMLTSYPGINQCDWLWEQTPHSFGKWGNIVIEKNHPQPDFLLLYQFDFVRKQSQPKRTWRQQLKQLLKPQPKPQQTDWKEQFRGVPKERMIYLLREPPLEEIVEINKANYEQAKNYCGYVSGPDDLAPVPDYMPAIWYHSNSFRELDTLEPPTKHQACSWITSGINRSLNHQRRLDFLRQVQTDLGIDIYGRNLPTWSKSRGSLSNKWHGMAPYYYNLAIENYAENDLYVSEKLWDSLLAWCLPIYYGGSAADKLLPPGSFLRLPSLDEKGVSYVKEVISTPDHWHQALPAIAEARKIILHKLNLLNWLSEFVAKSS